MFKLTSSVVLAALLFSGVTSASAATLRVEFATLDNTQIKTEKYLAIVGWHDSWQEPLIEKILPDSEGGAVVLDLPIGEYRIFCSALGYSLAFKPALELPAEGMTQSCQLRPLVLLNGQIRDSATGAAISEARIGFATLAALESPIRLSSLGDDHLRKNYVVQARPDGSFSLPVIPDYDSSLLIEAPDYGTRLLQNISFPDGASSLGEVLLQRGGSLSAELKSPVPGDLAIEHYKWALRPVNPDIEDLSYYLDRPLAVGQTAEWAGLEPGRYELWLRGRVKEVPGLRPYQLATVELAPGASESLQLQIPRAPHSLAKSDLNLRIPGGLRSGEQAFVDIWSNHHLTTISARAVRQDKDAVVVIDEVCEPGARFVLRTAMRVSRPVLVEDSCAVDVPLLAAATLQARLTVPKGYALPSIASVSLQPCEQAGLSASSEVGPYPFRIHPRKGTWATMVPAGCGRGVLQSSEFAPMPWPAMDLNSGGVYDLGSMQLTLGSALLVRVSDERGTPIPGAFVKVIAPEDFQREVVQILANQPISVGVTQKSDGWGWASFVGLSPGEVHVAVWASEKASAFTQRLVLEPGRELLVDDLNLQPPAILDVTVNGVEEVLGKLEPTVLALPFVGCNWFPYAPIFGDPIEGDGSEFRLYGPPGLWQLEVGSRADGEVGGAILTEEVEVFAGRQEIDLNLSKKIYRGRVERAGLPVIGKVFFRAEFGEEGSSTSVQTSDDGSFQVALKEPGLYSVQIREEEPVKVTTIPGVKATSTDQDILVELPVGAIRGRVVSLEGTAVPEVSVTAVQYREAAAGRAIRAAARSALSGAFSLDGLNAGVWRLNCRSGAYQCVETVIELLPDEQRSDVEMYLRAPLTIKGRVTTRQGLPVASAELQVAVWVVGSDKQPLLQTAFAGSGGYFEAALAPNYSLEGLQDRGVVSIAVKAPGAPIAAVRFPYSSEPLHLELPVAAGRLRIGLEGATSQPAGHGSFILVSQEGAWVLLNGFSTPGTVDWRSDSIAIPSITAGVWNLFRIQQLVDVFPLIEAGGTPEALASFEIRPGETTEVEISLPE